MHGPAEIPDDSAKRLWVKTMAWGICPLSALLVRLKACHGALVCRASGFCCGVVFQKQRICLDSEDISSALQHSSERVSPVAILLPLRISQEQGVRKETKDKGGFETKHQGRSGSIFSQHAATSDAELPGTFEGMCWQRTSPHRHYI